MGLVSLAFVTGPAPVPNIVQSLTTDPVWLGSVDDFSLGAPVFADPGSVGGADGYRTVEFTLRLVGAYSEVAAVQQPIVRQLLADRNWLMVQWQTLPQPMFLRTYRTSPQALQWEQSRGDVWTLRVSLTCDPYLYGAPVTVGPVTINNNPAHATNPCFYKFPTIKGDAPAPVKVTVVPSAATDGFDTFMSLAALDESQSPTVPYVWQTNGAALGTDTTHGTGSSTMSAGNYSTVTFATDTSMVTRLTAVAPSAVIPGTYKVFCRLARDNANTISARFGQAYNITGFRWGDTVTIASDAATGAHLTWADMGDFTFPVGAVGLDLDDAAPTYAPIFELQVQRVTGTGPVYVDAFVLVPIDTAVTVDVRSLLTQFQGYGLATTISGVWDGTKTPITFRAYTSGVLTPLRPPRINGATLRVHPGATNIFHLLQQTRIGSPGLATGANLDWIDRSATVTFTYSPLYLHVRPDGE